jgi:DNA ligase-associated metallophosphoesterase
MVEVVAGSEPMQLLADKAVFVPRHEALLVADAHIGKAVSFRRLGVPVPRGTTSDTLDRLSRALQRTGARHLVFLGDFLHSERAHAPATLAALARWRERHAALRVTLVRGNHDDRAGDPPAELGFEVVCEPWRLGGLALCHHPQAVADAYALAGHLHPCIGIGRGLDHLRLPCFWLGPQCAVLPAFGTFTGMRAVHAEEGDQVFAVAGDRVLPVR